MRAENMSNSMLIDYLYEDVEDFNDFISGDYLNNKLKKGEVDKFLMTLETIVQLHLDFIKEDSESNENNK